MKVLFIICFISVALVGCAREISEEEAVRRRAIERAEASWPGSSFARKSALASALLQNCQNTFAGKDVAKMMQTFNETLNIACALGIDQMEKLWLERRGTGQFRRFGGVPGSVLSIKVSGDNFEYYKQLADWAVDSITAVACNECLTEGVQHLRIIDEQNIDEFDEPLFDELLGYYSVYIQIYDLVIAPEGSAISYRQAIDDLRSETKKISSRIDSRLSR